MEYPGGKGAFPFEGGQVCHDFQKNVLRGILCVGTCTNVMLQCLDTESRWIFILGTMFKVDSRIAGDILGITPEAYRQRLSRIRGRMAEHMLLVVFQMVCRNAEYPGGKGAFPFRPSPPPSLTAIQKILFFLSHGRLSVV